MLISLAGHVLFKIVEGDREQRYYAVAKRAAGLFVLCVFALAWKHTKPTLLFFALQEVLLLRPRERAELYTATCFIIMVCAFTLAELTFGLSFLVMAMELAWRERNAWINVAGVCAAFGVAWLVWLLAPNTFLFIGLAPTLVKPLWPQFFIRIPFIVLACMRHNP